MKAIEPDLRVGGTDMLSALKKKGYRLIAARSGALSEEDLRVAKSMGLLVYLKGRDPSEGLLELPWGKGEADLYDLSRVKKLSRANFGRNVVLVNLRERADDLWDLRAALERNPRARFLFTVSPSSPSEVKDPRDLLAFLEVVLGMREEDAMRSVTEWPW